MAVNTDNFGFKKPDESDFYDVQDQNGNWDIADQELEKLNSPTFEDYTEDTSVPEAVTAIEALKSKSKIGMLLSNIKAAFKGACLIGHIVNNCVTDNPSLPLSAAQGKVLMDYYTKLYSDISDKIFYLGPNKTKTWTLRTPSFLMIGASNTTAGLLYILSNSFVILSKLPNTDFSSIKISVSDYQVTITNPQEWGINVIMLYT